MKRLLLAVVLVLVPCAVSAQAIGNGANSTGCTQYDNAVIANPAISHYWPLNEAAGSTTAIDKVGSSNLTVNTRADFGMRPLARDCETGVLFPNVSGSNLAIPNTPVLPASGAWTVEVLAQQVQVQNNNAVFSITGKVQIQFTGIVNAVTFQVNGSFSSNSSTFLVAAGMPILFDLVCNGSNSSTLWVNGASTVTLGATTCTGQTGAGTIGNSSSVEVEKVAVYTDAETQAQILARMANM